MDTREFERIKNIISKAELDSAKAQGKIESIKKTWMDKYGTDDVDEIRKIYDNLLTEKSKLEKKMEDLWNKLVSSCDWDALEKKLNG